MTVNILFFSTLRELTGLEELSMEWEDSASPISVGEILDQLYQAHPKLRAWDEQILIALDQTYVARDAPVSHGQELAVMPPAQGG